MHYWGAAMKTLGNRSSTHQCTCCQKNHSRQPGMNRRRFLSVGSGCVLGALGAATGAAAGKLPTVDIGSVKNFAQDGISEEFTKDDIFVIRYQGRLFATTTTCPHMGGTLQRDLQDTSRIKCGLHGSVFDNEGMVVVGPASSGLPRLGISVNKDGRAIVDPNKVFPQDKWTDKACYVEPK